MIAFDELLIHLGYSDSSHYRNQSSKLDPKTAHLFRAAFNAQVKGIYVFESSPLLKLTDIHQRTLPERPVVFLAEASTVSEAREIHRKLWNLGSAPFIIVKLPHQIRVYTGFEYSHEEDSKVGHVIVADGSKDLNQIIEILSATAIDSGKIWESNVVKKIDDNLKVDRKLLGNLRQLGHVLKINGLGNNHAHTLIGKYVYFFYLRHRNILTDAWLAEQNIDLDSVFSSSANLSGLRKLSQALERRFNGRVFPINFEDPSLQDKHVAWVASVFSGGEIHSSINNPQEIVQLHLPFRAYDFSYIPIETLSTIYEQFIDERKEKGAIYTPEYLADYLINEVEWAKPLEVNGKVLDPACGSGIFLVLAYRRLIEKEMSRSGGIQLSPEKLKQILENSIYGVERELDACYVTEFSLILTLLHYVKPPELEKLEFKFPELHNKQIFNADFFNIDGAGIEDSIWQKNIRFDWIIGNPPWTEHLHLPRDRFILSWINSRLHAVSGKRTAEAFSWLATKLVKEQGIVGFLLPATSLFNANSKKYRQEFFTKNEVLRVTNFANLREILFGKGKSSVLSAATFIYRPTRKDVQDRPDIFHYAPFTVNQTAGGLNHPWTITINENEIQLLSASTASNGETSFWKFALWGTHLDLDAIDRINYLFPIRLSDFCRKSQWYFQQASELRSSSKTTSEKVKTIEWLANTKRFNTKAVKDSPFRFAVGPDVLEDIPPDFQSIRVQGGERGLDTTFAPHLIISPVWGRYIIYSDENFVLPARQIGISQRKNLLSDESTPFLKAVAILLRSSIVAYHLFFQASQWGVFRNAKLVTTKEVGNIRIPDLTKEQAAELAQFHDQIALDEKDQFESLMTQLLQKRSNRHFFEHNTETQTSLDYFRELPNTEKRKVNKALESFRAQVQVKLDKKIFELFNVPEDIQLLVQDFVNIRLALDAKSKLNQATRSPDKSELESYAETLREELDAFVMGAASHSVEIGYSEDLVECAVQINHEGEKEPSDLTIVQRSEQTKGRLLRQLSEELRENISQWVYVQRSLRLFDGPRVYIYKSPRLIDWTRTQALNDAGDIIGEVFLEPEFNETGHTHS